MLKDTIASRRSMNTVKVHKRHFEIVAYWLGPSHWKNAAPSLQTEVLMPIIDEPRTIP